MQAIPTRQAISGPSVWTGRDYASNEDWILHLTATHLAEIDTAAGKVPDKIPALYDVTEDDFPLPSLGPALTALGDELEHGRGFVLIRGLPVERYSEDRLAAIFWGLGVYFGVGLAQSTKGDRLGHVIDLSGPESDVGQMRNYELGGDLRMHTDLNNDMVGLLMLRAAKSGGESRIASSMAIHNIILDERPEFLEALFRGYYFHHLRKERTEGTNRTAHRVPVFSDYDGALSCHFNPSPVERAVTRAGVTLSALEAGAFQFFAEVATRPDVCFDMALRPGDIQLLNNHIVLHGRTDYEDYPESERRRHLLRLWLRCAGARTQAPETQVYKTDALGFRNVTI
ncbi:MAG: TauD/TfdA family dioxygenase [Alphaproteobacteria bacterium]